MCVCVCARTCVCVSVCKIERVRERERERENECEREGERKLFTAHISSFLTCHFLFCCFLYSFCNFLFNVFILLLCMSANDLSTSTYFSGDIYFSTALKDSLFCTDNGLCFPSHNLSVYLSIEREREKHNNQSINQSIYIYIYIYIYISLYPLKTFCLHDCMFAKTLR